MACKLPDFSAEYLRSVLCYDSESGEFRWNYRRDVTQSTNKQRAGKIAGWINDQGYRVIEIGERNYRAQILAWLYTYGSVPTDEIDHINNNRSDNRLTNLRQCSRNQNSQNSLKRRDNSSGFKGVGFSRQKNRWRSRLHLNGKDIHLGFYRSKSMGSGGIYSRSQKAFLHGEFANGGEYNDL